MTTVMEIECNPGDRVYYTPWFPHTRIPQTLVPTHHRVVVPEPYQAGDTPSETFIDVAGIPRERLKQYGQQPRPTRD